MSISVETDIHVIDYPSPNNHLLQEIQLAANGLDCNSFTGLGTLHEYRVLIDKAREVKAHLEGLEIPRIEGLEHSTQAINEIVDEIQSLDFDFSFETKIDDSIILGQLVRFVTAMSTLQNTITKFSPKVSISGTINLPDSLQEIQSVVTQLKPMIECSRKTVEHLKSSRQITDETQEALLKLENVIEQAKNIFEESEKHEYVCTSVNKENQMPEWALVLCIVLPIVFIAATVIGIRMWLWKRKVTV
jgi:hypothetical protein